MGYPLGWGDNAFGWGGLAALSDTPDEVVVALQEAFATVLASDELAAELEGNVGAMINYVSPEDFGAMWSDSETLLAPHVENILASSN